jgi:hypothetical protein
MTGRCALCPDLEIEGMAKDVLPLLDAHRAKEHPEIIRKVRRPRQRGNPKIIAWRQSLTEEENEQIDRERKQRMFLLGQKEIPPDGG